MFFELGFIFSDKHCHNLFLISERNNKFSSYFELCHKRIRNYFCACCYQNRIKRSFFWESFIAVSENKFFWSNSNFRQKAFCFFKQFVLSFDAVHLSTHQTKYSRLITRSGADFENFIFFFEFEKLGLKSNGIRLRNGLSCTYGKGLVLISEIFKSGIHKQVSGDFFNSFQYFSVCNSFFLQDFNQLISKSFMFWRIVQGNNFLEV